LSFFGVLCGDALNVGAPADGSVTSAKLGGSLSVGLTGGSASTPSLFFTGDANTGIFSPTADTIAFAEGGAEAMRIDSSGRLLIGTPPATANGGVLELSGGITFPATAVAATDPNTLDDYEEGTWTPVIKDDLGNTATMTSGASGHYTKIGNVVTAYFNQISWSSKGTLASVLRIDGLPFTSKTGNRSWGILGSSNTGALSNVVRVSLLLEANVTMVAPLNINTSTNTDSNISVTDLGTSGIIYGMQLTYVI
jgi:hypothetical protein